MDQRGYQQFEDYIRVEKAIRFIEENFKSQPNLDQIAESIHLSRFHVIRLFKRWAGITPTQFLQFLTLEYTKQKLAESTSIFETSLEAGLSGSSRLHDLFVTFESITPGEFKKQGAGLKIFYGFHYSPFGECLLALTERGICRMGFVETGEEPLALEQLRREWPGAIFTENQKLTQPMVEQLFRPTGARESHPFHLYLKGTNFQINVWKALLTIPEGRMVSYQDIATLIGNPKAFRTVASAVAVNPVGYLIPCHRVIEKSGRIHKYRWGSLRKKALLGWEAARTG